MTFSSDDWGLSVISPFLTIHGAHTREAPPRPPRGENSARPPLPPATERVDIHTILRGFTINGAYPFRLEDRIGSLEVGKLADLVVLNEDLFTIDPKDIPDLHPSAVMMEGVLVHGELPGVSSTAVTDAAGQATRLQSSKRSPPPADRSRQPQLRGPSFYGMTVRPSAGSRCRGSGTACSGEAA